MTEHQLDKKEIEKKSKEKEKFNKRKKEVDSKKPETHKEQENGVELLEEIEDKFKEKRKIDEVKKEYESKKSEINKEIKEKGKDANIKETSNCSSNLDDGPLSGFIDDDINKFELNLSQITKRKDSFNDLDISEEELKSILYDLKDIEKSNIQDIINHRLYFIKEIISFFNKGNLFNQYLLELNNEINQFDNKKTKNDIINNCAFADKDNQNKNENEANKKGITNVKGEADNDVKIEKKNNDQNNINKNNDNNSYQAAITRDINNYNNNNFNIIKDNVINININDDIIYSNIENINNLKSNSYINNNIENNNSVRIGSGVSQEYYNDTNQEAKQDQNSSTINSDLVNPISTEETIVSFSINKSNNQNNSKYEEAIENIFTKENDKVLSFVNKEIVDGDSFESNGLNNFELFCNFSLKRIIKIKRLSDKSANEFNSFFKKKNLNILNKDFQIDLHIDSLTGEEIRQIYKNFQKNFLLFDEKNFETGEEYEIIGEICKDIINQSKQKYVQVINFIRLIKNCNEIKNMSLNEDEEQKYSLICKNNSLTKKNEKIFVILSDGSYFILKYVIQFIEKNEKFLEKLIDIDYPLKKINEYLTSLIKNDNLAKTLEIKNDYIISFSKLYFELKNSKIKFFIVFISDTIEDKFENRIKQKIKMYLYDETYYKSLSDPLLNFLNKYKEREKEKIFYYNIIQKMKTEIKNFLQINETKFIDNIKNYIHEYFDKKKLILLNILDSIFKNEEISKFNPQSIIKRDFFTFLFVIIGNKNNNEVIESIEKQIKNIHKYEIIEYDKINNELKEKIKNVKNKFNGKFVYTYYLVPAKEYGKEINNNLEDREILKYDFENNVVLMDLKTKYLNNIYKICKFYYKRYYSTIKKNFNKSEVLNSLNFVEKIEYDLKKLKLNIIIGKDQKEKIIDLLKYNENEDKDINNIANDYFMDLVKMIQKLLSSVGITKINNDFKKYNDLFMNNFRILFENLKCKYFYYYLWCINIPNKIGNYLLNLENNKNS